jgi:hypothetical protein
LLIADCRLKKWCGNFFPYQSAIGNRKSVGGSWKVGCGTFTAVPFSFQQFVVLN